VSKRRSDAQLQISCADSTHSFKRHRSQCNVGSLRVSGFVGMAVCAAVFDLPGSDDWTTVIQSILSSCQYSPRSLRERDQVDCGTRDPGNPLLSRNRRTRPSPALKQSSQRARLEGLQFLAPTVTDLLHPRRIAEQGAADGHQIEVATLQAANHLVDAACLRAFTAKAADELATETHGTHRDGGLASELLGPAGKVEIRTGELRLPVAALRASLMSK